MQIRAWILMSNICLANTTYHTRSSFSVHNQSAAYTQPINKFSAASFKTLPHVVDERKKKCYNYFEFAWIQWRSCIIFKKKTL